MGKYIIVVLALVVIVIAILRVKKYFKGSGSCGCGSSTIRDGKTLTEPKLGEKVMRIEGMRGEKCEIRVENALNRLDGVACKVSWEKKNAVVAYSTEISDALLKETVEKLGFKVTDIQ